MILCLHSYMFCHVKSYVVIIKIRKQAIFPISCVLSYDIVILICNHRKLHWTDVKMYMIALQCVREVNLKLTLSSSSFLFLSYYLLGSAWLVKHFVTPAKHNGAAQASGQTPGESTILYVCTVLNS